MKVYELKEILSHYDDDVQINILQSVSMLPDNLYKCVYVSEHFDVLKCEKTLQLQSF